MLHKEVRWLSRGKVLLRFKCSYRTKASPYQMFSKRRVAQSTGIHDIFSSLNELNLGLQRLSINVLDVQHKINAVLKKMELFKIKVKTGDVSAFPALESFLCYNDLTLDVVRGNIIAHLISLRQQFHEYFPATAEANNWMRNLFSIVIFEIPKDFTVGEWESLILSCTNNNIEVCFSQQSVIGLLDIATQQIPCAF